MDASEESVSLKLFTESFFAKLKCVVSWDGKVLKVDGVPKGFEAFVGKKGPYELVFRSEDLANGRELLSKGGFFLTAMANYLKSASKTTLVKLVFPDLNPQAEIETRFTLTNSQVAKIRVTNQLDYLTRFTFSTTFQYLNKKEHETNSIYVKDGKVVNFNVEQFQSVDGKKKDIEVGDLKEDYKIAQEVVKGKMREKTAEVSEMLSQILKKELERIEGHFAQQIKEAEEEVKSVEHSIEKIKHQLLNAPEEEKENLNRKLARFEAQLVKVKQEGKVDSVVKEKNFFIEDEKQKYSLNVNNSLINTSVIYYPLFTFHVELKASNGARANVSIPFDPIQKFMPGVEIPGMDGKQYKFHVDAAGNICTEDQLVECFESGKRYANFVMNITCAHSKKPVYKDNAAMCSKSMKHYGKSYVKEDYVTGRPVYIGYLKRCPASGKYTTSENFKPCPSCGTLVTAAGIKRSFRDGRVHTGCGCCDK